MALVAYGLNVRPPRVCFTARNGRNAPGEKSRLYTGWSRLLLTQLYTINPYCYRCTEAYSLPRRNRYIPSPRHKLLPH